jgi:hypothetical protein
VSQVGGGVGQIGRRQRAAERRGDHLPDLEPLAGESAQSAARRALVEMGVEPGKDAAVVVIVDTALCRFYSPPLTAFRPALEPLGRRLGEMLLAFMPAFGG